MEKLMELSLGRIESVGSTFKRYLYWEIDWKDRLIAILGARGSGKTTLLLQYIRDNPIREVSLYLSLDNLMFQSVNLVDVVDHYYKLGIRYVFLDEVHKYSTWSIEIKNLYDQYPELKIVFTGSSALEISKGRADLSRRLMVYQLPGMSFREFLRFDKNIELGNLSLSDIIHNHVAISRDYKSAVSIPLAHFRRYLKIGYYPYYQENENNYYHRLMNTVNLILETDLMAIENITYASLKKIKSLLFIISQSVPFEPNISELGKRIEAKRETVLQFLDLLQRTSILMLLRTSSRGISHLNKPEKIYLENTNLIHALAEESPNAGNERETFFLNQLSKKHVVTSPPQGDFKVDNKYTFEVGGKPKKQVQSIKNSFIVADDVETGAGNKIPLWLFGFLY